MRKSRPNVSDGVGRLFYIQVLRCPVYEVRVFALKLFDFFFCETGQFFTISMMTRTSSTMSKRAARHKAPKRIL